MEEQKSIWLDGELVPWADATVHVQSYGLLLGIGFFEAFRCYETPDGPALFRVHDHLARLRRTMHTYLAAPPYSNEDIVTACRDVLADNELTNAYLRVLLVLGPADNPALATYRTAVIATGSSVHMDLPEEGGIHAKISSIQRPSPNAIPPAAKATGQYLNAYLAQVDARISGYNDALLLNTAGNLVDGWVHNVFLVRDGVLLTPPIAAGALAGITRATVMTLAEDQGVPVREDNLIRSDVYTADEAFLTGSSTGIVPVLSVDRRQIGGGKPGEITMALREAYDDAIHGRTDAHPEWREPLGAKATT